MDCKNISNHIIDFVDGKLSISLTTEVENHFKECATCRLEYQQTQELFDSFENISQEEPGSELRLNFNKVLKEEKAALRTKNESYGYKTIQLKNYKMLFQIAAAVLLLVSGYLAGYNSNGPSRDNEVVKLQNDIDEMRQQMQVINLLKNESASQRIKAVNYTEEIQHPNRETIEALINTLGTDPSSNVRLAAVYSLARFKTNEKVKKAFINTLNKQDDPMIQIVIINLLVEMEEVKALDEMKKLLNKKDLHEEVKSQAELGVKVLS